jgi:hypothetical protein
VTDDVFRQASGLTRARERDYPLCLLPPRAVAQIIAITTSNRDRETLRRGALNADQFFAWKSSKQLVVATTLCAAQLKFVDDQLMVLLRVKRPTDCLRMMYQFVLIESSMRQGPSQSMI